MDHHHPDREDPRDHLHHTTCKDPDLDKALLGHRSTCSNIRPVPQATPVNIPDSILVHQVDHPDSSKVLPRGHHTDHLIRVLPKVHPECPREWSPDPEDIRRTRWHRTRVHRRQVRCSREVPAVPAREWPVQEVPTWADQVVQI